MTNGIADDNGPGGAAPWMDWMRNNIGQIQQTGAVPTPFTTMIFSHTNFGKLNGHTPESCAATVCAALELTGYKSTRSAAAFSYHDYGTHCDLMKGCIVVYQWSNGQHHVNFCDQINQDGTIVGLGGNQSHSLNDTRFSKNFIIATRWPVKAPNAGIAPLALTAAWSPNAVETQTFTVHQGARYEATVHLNGIEQLASNEFIGQRLASLGFENVDVQGTGAERHAVGTWSGPTTTAALDEHLIDVHEVQA